MAAASSSVVVVGAGQAGGQVAVSLREQGYRGPITVVGAESVAPYQRPPLTKAYLAGRTDVEGLLTQKQSYYADNDIDLVLDDPVAVVDRAARVVVLSSGRTLEFGDLVLATGAEPRTLPGTFSLRTIADVDAVRARLDGPSRVVVIGAGFIGLEFAAVAREQGHDVTVVEALPRAMARAVTPFTSAHVVSAHERSGVRILLGTQVKSVRPDVVELADGTLLPADLVVAGIGVVPNTELAAGAGLTVDDGVVVDAHLRTDDPSIYAIGDCARFSSPRAGRRIRLESVQNAVDQAACVAASITGSAEPYTGLPWFWSDQYAVRLQIAGLVDGHDRTVVTGDPDGGRFSVFCFRGDRLLGVEAVNKPADYMMARRLLSAGGTVSPDVVAAPGFDLRTYVQGGAVAA
ncbi:NAD(P)/FAD-dependent oxidoreductase [Nocardia sp. NRRL S-836]|uniref:NAD(P)/FAD-dependent oxidoreductase n=1 Tax=Nocardia sp. NRRL S-836 TaxID=1519492 RepID=UPI0006AE2758|nr:FAD-dependent oxidoreductase [Nocardia sp. NRRL S-836]KOV80025.1 pyridine nucleotide-disulfide oxidoreductase [Nocardia sp. NRRL S-836]